MSAFAFVMMASPLVIANQQGKSLSLFRKPPFPKYRREVTPNFAKAKGTAPMTPA
jgi:hypothetical protein